MDAPFAVGDNLIFQLESGFGLLRVIDIEERDGRRVWHLMAYDEFFPDPEMAEIALQNPDSLHVRKAHMALTERAFERTPAAKLNNRPVTDAEQAAYKIWQETDGQVSDRSALLMLGVR